VRWESDLTIDAPVDLVWQLTIGIEHWPALTPTVTRLERLDDGPLRPGSRARLKQPRQAEAVWTVVRLDEGREFTWRTRRPGLTMVGSHLLREEGGRCRNTLVLELTGFLAPLVGRLVGRLVQNSIDTENASFRAAAERPRATGRD
jgi:uncharacterized membrane protein